MARLRMKPKQGILKKSKSSSKLVIALHIISITLSLVILAKLYGAI